MSPEIPEIASPVPEALLTDGMWILDLVLAAGPTPLMDAATAQGATAANGQASFLAAAAESIRRLTGKAGNAEALTDGFSAGLLGAAGIAAAGAVIAWAWLRNPQAPEGTEPTHAGEPEHTTA